MVDIISDRLNGNVRVVLKSDGTKIRSCSGDPYPEFPESVDIKITDYCDAGCAFCHEDSTESGKHGDMDFLIPYSYGYPPGTELAIGGGNPLAHPQLTTFLRSCLDGQLIPNITINQLHVERYRDLITRLVKDKLVYGIGISGTTKVDWLHELTDNVVYHVISGVHAFDIVRDLPKVLVLGYKMFRRGVDFHSAKVDKCKLDWWNRVCELFGRSHVSFDNLAIEQLRLRRFFSADEWDKFFMGADGTHTCYVDGVNQQFAKSSTSIMRRTLRSPKQDFDDVKNKLATA